MSELKRNQSLYNQPASAGRMPCRAAPTREPARHAAEPAELRLLEPFEITAVQGGDPYNGIGSRAAAAAAHAAQVIRSARRRFAAIIPSAR